jgi:hypothetical protein
MVSAKDFVLDAMPDGDVVSVGGVLPLLFSIFEIVHLGCLMLSSDPRPVPGLSWAS